MSAARAASSSPKEHGPQTTNEENKETMSYEEDMRDERRACAEDAVRDDIDEVVAGRYGFAFYLAVGCLGWEAYDEWRSQSYDVPSVDELVELAIQEGPGLMEFAALVGIDYAALADEAQEKALRDEARA